MLSKLGLIQINFAILVQISQIRKVLKTARTEYLLATNLAYILLFLFCYSQETKEPTNPCYTALVRLERMDFLQPMYIGEVAELHAEITHTAHHSLEIQVKVWAENIMKGNYRVSMYPFLSQLSPFILSQFNVLIHLLHNFGTRSTHSKIDALMH